MSNNDNQPDWDKITEGKIRHGFAVAAFTSGMKLTEELCHDIEAWVKYVVNGVDAISSTDDTSDDSVNDEINVSDIIHAKVKTLKAVDRDRVLKALEDGDIRKDNLDGCLLRIERIIETYGG